MVKRLYYFCAYWGSWIVFGLAALALSLVCLVLLLVPGRERGARGVRAVIHGLFAGWVRWLRATGVFVFAGDGALAAAVPRPAVVVANHPSLVDATFLLSQLPDAVCILKPSLLRHPLLGPAARMAGYLGRESGIDLVRAVAAQVAGGRTLLVFPEGTRTDAGSLCNPLKTGFALIARRAGVPIQVVIVRTGRDLLPRGQPWWRMPQLPIHYAIAVDRAIDASGERPLADIVAEVRGRFITQLGCAP